LLSTALLTLAGAVAVLALIGQTMSAPDWLRDRIATRLEARLGGMQIVFGDVELVINRGWRPRARLRDVTLSDGDGRPILRLADAEASLAMRPLLEGRLQPKQIALTGLFAVLRRGADGAVSLAIGDAARPAGEAAGFAQLVQQIDTVLATPQLSALTSIDLNALTLRYEDARAGRAWTVDDGYASLTRQGGDLRLAANLALLSGRDYAATLEANYESRIGQTTAEFGLTLSSLSAQDFAGQSVALAWLDVLRAPVSGAVRGTIDETGALGPINATLQIGAGALQPSDRTTPIPFRSARTYFTFDPGTEVLVFDEVQVESAWVTGSGEGRAWLGGIETGRLDDLIGQITLTSLSGNPAGLYDDAVRLEGAQADFRLTLDPFELRLGEMLVHDQGRRMRLDGTLKADTDGWDVAVNGRMGALAPARLVELWPEQAVPKTRAWLAENLGGGRLTDIHFALRGRSGQKPEVYLDFDYADTDVKFMKTLPPLTDASGHASFLKNRFVTTATKGWIEADEGGRLDMAGTSFIIPDVTVRGGTPALVRIEGRGPVTAALSLLNRAPLSVMDKANLPVDLAAGEISVAGTVAVPLKDKVPFEEVEFHFAGTATDVMTDRLVPGQRLAAERLRLRGDSDDIEISGDGTIGGVPASAAWRTAIGPDVPGSSATGTIELSPALLETFDIALPPGTVTGRGTAGFTLDLPKGAPPRLAARSDLAGVGLRIPELGWSSAPGATGALALDIRLGESPRIDAVSLDVSGLDATGSVTLAEGGALERAQFSSVRLGGWLDAQVVLTGQGRSAPPAVAITGGTLDLREAEFGEASAGSGQGGRARLTASLDRLVVTDTIALTGFEGQFTTSAGLDGEFRGRINGSTPVTGRIVPDGGRSAVRVVSGDAGGVFRDAGLLKQARGGDFTMSLRPVGDAGAFEGSVQVTNTRVQNAPAIAALLNSVSIIGLLDELSGQGILFSEVSARFRLDPSRVSVYESSAVGPSIGISMDGTYDVPSQRLNMQGVISPVYLINGIGSVLTRRGEGLIGFSYKLTGAASDPSVQVNPLSALTPGIFREIFRNPAPQPPAAASSSGASPPEPEPRREVGRR
jgi:hypothetical protein